MRSSLAPWSARRHPRTPAQRRPRRMRADRRSIIGRVPVPSGHGLSMIAHNAADPEKVDKARRETVRRGLTLVVPVALVLALGAPLVLALFGPHYAATGTGALALVALSAIPNVITAAATSTARVRQRRGVQFGVPTTLS